MNDNNAMICIFWIISSWFINFTCYFSDSIQQLCQLSRYRGESIGQVQQRNYGSTPSEACLEAVHPYFEAPKTYRQVEGNPAHYQRVLLKSTANEVKSNVHYYKMAWLYVNPSSWCNQETLVGYDWEKTEVAVDILLSDYFCSRNLCFSSGLLSRSHYGI